MVGVSSEEEGGLSLARAAELAGVSRDTLKRRLKRGAFPGAHRGSGSGPGGPWLIPVGDLEAAGLIRHPADPNADDPGDVRIQLAVAQAEVRLLRAHLADLRRLLATTPGRDGS